MKPILLIVFTFASALLSAQIIESAAPNDTRTKHRTMTVRKPHETVVIPEMEVFKVVEQMPVFPGGEQALLRYLSSIPYPSAMRQTGFDGKFYVQFIIDAEGKAVEPIVVSGSVAKAVGNVALNHILNMPRWQPGRQRGQPVAVQMVIPFYIRVE